MAGFFIIAAFISVVIFVLSSTKLTNKKTLQALDIHITGSVIGLTEGSKISFNGIAIGEVKQLVLSQSNLNMVIAHTLVDVSAPIRHSTIAELSSSGFTGAAIIDLHGGNLADPLIFSLANSQTPYLLAQSTSFNTILASSQTTLAQATLSINKLNRLLDQISEPVKQTIDNMQSFTATLRDNKGNVQHVILQSNKTLKALENAANSVQTGIAPLSGSLSTMSGGGLKSIQQKLLDSARSIDRIERSINDLKRNPQRIIWGGSDSIPRL